MPVRYGTALAAVVLASLLRWSLDPLLGGDSPLFIFTLPIVVAALYGGPGPALLATVAGAASGTYFFIGEIGWPPPPETYLPRLVLFLLSGAAISALGWHLRAAQAAARARAEELQQALSELSDASRHKDNFLAMLGHELRNPLAAITTATELGRLSGQRSGDALEAIARQTAVMSRIVDDLQDASRLARGHTHVEKAPVRLQHVLETAADQVRESFSRKRQSLRFYTPAEPVQVNGDFCRLVQLCANLLDNASKYSGEGTCITASLATRANHAELSVADEGEGIAADMLPRVFDMFVQGERPNGAVGGLGMGLAVVKSLAELHGGEVTAESGGPGKGSRFVVRLPR